MEKKSILLISVFVIVILVLGFFVFRSDTKVVSVGKAYSSSVGNVGGDLSEYPISFFNKNNFNAVMVVGDNLPSGYLLGPMDVFNTLHGKLYKKDGKTYVVKIGVGSTKLASGITNVAAQNLIAFGDPCGNAVVGKFISCSDWSLGSGNAIIKLFKNGANSALVVAGSNMEDTNMGAKVLANYEKYALSGSEVCVSGTINSINVQKGGC
jgi:hypothetical protein